MTPAPEAEHPNAAIIRQLYDRLGNGDLTGFLDLIADDAVFHVGGDSIVAGDYVGKDAIVNLGLKVFEETNGTHRTDLLDVLANDSHTSALHRWSAERRGTTIAMNNLIVYRLADGKVVERWEYIENRDTHDKFWSP